MWGREGRGDRSPRLPLPVRQVTPQLSESSHLRLQGGVEDKAASVLSLDTPAQQLSSQALCRATYSALPLSAIPGQGNALSCPSISTVFWEVFPTLPSTEGGASGWSLGLPGPALLLTPPFWTQFTHLDPEVLDFQIGEARMVSCR